MRSHRHVSSDCERADDDQPYPSSQPTFLQCLRPADSSAELMGAVHQLKVDRDNWQAIANQYKTALEAQTARLRELQDICFATQAELENQQFQNRRLALTPSEGFCDRAAVTEDGTDLSDERLFSTAIIFPTSRNDLSWRERTARNCSNPVFTRVQISAQRRDHGTALIETEQLLRGPLSTKGRIEGLLLKSGILQAIGCDYLYDALAACSEGLEICDRTRGLEGLLPKIQYQRGICFYQLRMLRQARDAFGAAGDDKQLLKKADTYRKLCEFELDMVHWVSRRSGFDEDRMVPDQILAQLDEESFNVSRISLKYSM
jgi:hypothetical protein